MHTATRDFSFNLLLIKFIAVVFFGLALFLGGGVLNAEASSWGATLNAVWTNYCGPDARESGLEAHESEATVSVTPSSAAPGDTVTVNIRLAILQDQVDYPGTAYLNLGSFYGVALGSYTVSSASGGTLNTSRTVVIPVGASGTQNVTGNFYMRANPTGFGNCSTNGYEFEFMNQTYSSPGSPDFTVTTPTPACDPLSQGKTTATQPTNLCSSGNPVGPDSNPTSWDWRCTASGKQDAICSAPKPVVPPPACGLADSDTPTAIEPTQNLCSSGSLTTARVDSNPTSWDWACGASGYSNVFCSAPKPTKIDGACGLLLESCVSGSQTTAVKQPNGDYHWYCKGINGGRDSNLCYYASPSCTLTFDKTTVNSGEPVKLTWTTSRYDNNVATFNISEFGDLTVLGGSMTINPTVSKTYYGTIYDKIEFSPVPLGNCSATINVGNAACTPVWQNCSGYWYGGSCVASCPNGTTPGSITGPNDVQYCGLSYNSCVPSTSYSCTGTVPSNASMYPNDNTGLTGNTPYVFSSVNTAAKCEYGCVAGYSMSGGVCVAKPDLSVQSISPDGESFLPSARIDFLGAITDAYQAVPEAGKAMLHIDWDSDGSVTSVDLGNVGALALNQAKNLMYQTQFPPLAVGTHRYRFQVDTLGGVDESDETNNYSAWRTFTVTNNARPDLDASFPLIASTVAAGSAVTINTGSIWNIGTAAAPPGYLIGGFYIDSSDADTTANYTQPVGPIGYGTAVNGSQSAEAVWNIPPDIPPGIYYVGYIANEPTQFPELDDATGRVNNWSGWRQFTVTAPVASGANVKSENIRIQGGASAITVNQGVNFDADVVNTGSINTRPNFKDEFWLKVEGTSTWIPDRTNIISSVIPAGGKATDSTYGMSFGSVGKVTIRHCVNTDPAFSAFLVAETNTTDNCSEQTFNINAAGTPPPGGGCNPTEINNCSLNGGSNGQTVPGTCTTSGSCSYTCKDGNFITLAVTNTCAAPPTEKYDISANPPSVSVGRQSDIRWNTENIMGSCTVRVVSSPSDAIPNAGRAWIAPNDTQTSAGLTQDTIFGLYCDARLLKTVTVKVRRDPTLTATPRAVPEDDKNTTKKENETTLTWDTNIGTAGGACELTAKPLGGNQTVIQTIAAAPVIEAGTLKYEIIVDTLFTLSCVNGGSASVTVFKIPVINET